MITGAIIGDIVGSRFEWHNIKSKEFPFWEKSCQYTDDTVMTLAIAEALMNADETYSDLSECAVQSMQRLGREFKKAGYGSLFRRWLKSDNPQPYGSFGNGSAMRVSPCAYVAKSPEQVKELSYLVTAVTHDHEEGIKGAEAVAVAVYLARTGSPMQEIRQYIEEHYYTLDFTLDGIRHDYKFNATCQGSVPQALQAFFESNSFEDAIRNAISIGGDSDTIAAICGSVAGPFYSIPPAHYNQAMTYLPPELKSIISRFNEKYGS